MPVLGVIATVVEGLGLGIVAGAAMVYAWAEPKIAELREALGGLPHLYAEALEDIEALDAENAQLHGELADADERAQEARAALAVSDREADMRARADRLGVRHLTVAELLGADQ